MTADEWVNTYESENDKIHPWENAWSVGDRAFDSGSGIPSVSGE